MTRVVVARWIVLRIALIGLISGSGLGILFGLRFGLLVLWTGIVGAGLGLGLGFVNGLLLSAMTCLFFYPIKQARLYRAIAELMSAVIAGAGVAAFGPWYFSSTSMTPSSAVFIGFGSVLASAIAGWAGALAGQNIAHWYERANIKPSIAEKVLSTRAMGQASWHPKAILFSQRAGWMGVALLAVLSSVVGHPLLQFLVCGAQDIFTCLPSPRLYTSVIAGFKVTIPIIFAAMIMVAVLKRWYERHT